METQQPNPDTVFHISDLATTVKWLEIAIDRGTFKANEVGEVGILYNKLKNIVIAYNNAIEQAQPDNPENKEQK